MTSTAPDSTLTEKFSAHEKDFLTHVEEGLQVKTTPFTGGATGVMGMLQASSGTTVLTGKAAMATWVQRISRRQGDPSNPDPSSLLTDLEVVFHFPWMLTKMQLDIAHKWKSDFIARKKGQLESQVTALVPLAVAPVAASSSGSKQTKKKKGIARRKALENRRRIR